jgi:transposase
MVTTDVFPFATFQAAERVSGMSMDSMRFAVRKKVLIELAATLENVSEACRRVGFSRDTYYRIRKLKTRGESGGGAAGKPRNYSAKTLQGKREMEDLVLETARNNPGLGKRRLARIIQGRGVYISSSGVYNILKKKIAAPAESGYCPI